MNKSQKIVAALAVAAAFGVVTFTMWTRHSSQATNDLRARADVLAPQLDDEAITKVLSANNVPVSGLLVRSVGGIVILRGKGDRASAEQAVAIVKSLGATRVANLITPVAIDDEAMRREAERQLASRDSLAGCLLKVHCEKGVISVTGTVLHELQKDAARSALRSIGAREVRVDLSL